METATKTVEALSQSFSEPSMQERFEDFARRSSAHSEKEKKEKHKNAGPRDVKLEDRSDDEKKFIEAVGEKDESDKKPAKGSTEKDAAKPATKEIEKLAAKAGEKVAAKLGEKPAASESSDSHVEPIAADLAERHWQGKLQGQEVETHIGQVNGRIGVVLDFLSSHPQKAQMEDGFRALFTGRPPASQQAFFRDLAVCLAEVPNREKVFQHITLQPQDREFLRNVKNPKDLRAAIQTIAKHYPATAAPQASPKPRAPKPPSEVGGRGAAGDDGTRGADGFSDFSARQSQIHAG